jgi:hypothetical protein
MSTSIPPGCLYVFLDEGGNFDFSPKGTQYFTLTALTTTRPFLWDPPLMSLKYDELERGSRAECFHATEDKQVVRNRVFAVIADHLSDMRLDCIIVEKRKTVPELQIEEKFYPRILGYLLRYVMQRESVGRYAKVMVMSDAIPINKKRKAIEKAVEETLAHMLSAGTSYEMLHHESKSCLSLQVADYCNWAIYRKWAQADERSYQVIRGAIRSEFDIFRRGATHYY